MAKDQRHLRAVLELEQLSPWRSAFLLRLEVAGDVRDWTDPSDTARERGLDAGAFEDAVDPLPDHEWELLDRIFLRERELTRERLLAATEERVTVLWEVLRAELGGSRLGQ